MTGRRNIALAAAAAVMAVSPFFLDAYWVDVLNNIGLYAILALSLNLILGYAGLFHMGHAAFYAVGAYTTAILNTRYGIPVLWLMPVSGLFAGLFALIVARPIIRLRGDYLLIVTIGVVEIVRITLVNDIFGLTGGSNGIFGISRPTLFGYVIRRPSDFFFLIWFFLAVTVFLFVRIERSRFGRALKFIKADEVAAEGSGINTGAYKLAAFVLGAVWAGMAGTVFAAKMTIIAPESFNFWESVILFSIVILGGSGNIAGVILGAFLIVGLPEIFRDLSSARMLFFGAAMVLMMIFRNEGLLPPKPVVYDLAGDAVPPPDKEAA
ncbi:branched-chain amino acid ABC transporter permease [Desulfatiferula olefinivorans]